MSLFFPSIPIALAAAMIFLPGCQAPTPPSDTLVLAVEAAPRNLDPVQSTDVVSQKINNLIQSGLVRFGADMRLNPELAESWDHASYKVFHFRLKQGLKFQDGSPIHSEDVVRTFDHFRNPKSASPISLALKEIGKVRSAGDRDVYIETLTPQPFLLQNIAAVKIFKKSGEKIIGAGRFRVIRIDNVSADLERFDGFQEQTPEGAYRSIRILFLHDDTTRYQLLARGEVNAVINGMSLTKTGYLRDHLPPGLRIEDSPGTVVSYLAFNFRKPVFRNLKVRQAFAHAINIPEILKHRYGALAYPASSLLAPMVPGFESATRRYAYDPALAEKLLDEAGYPRGKNGFRFPLLYKCTSEKTALDVGRLLTEDLRKIGIETRIQLVDLGTFYADLKSGNFDVFTSRWVGVTNPSIYEAAFNSQRIKDGNNRGAYSNPEMDRLLELAMHETADVKRGELFSRIQKLAAEDLPYVMLWHWNNTFILPREAGNIVKYPNGDYMTLAQLVRTRR